MKLGVQKLVSKLGSSCTRVFVHMHAYRSVCGVCVCVYLCVLNRINYFTMISKHHVNQQVVTPMLRTLGNICSGPDDYSLMACENPRLMPALLKLLESPLSHVIKETVWVISNMTGKHACFSLLTCLKPCDVVKETVWVISNGTGKYVCVCVVVFFLSISKAL